MSRPNSLTRGLVLAIAIPILAFCTLLAWSLSSAVASSPDDDFHLPAIWCGLGERPGLCEDPGDPVERLVPRPLVNATCYAFDPNESAACWNEDAQGMAIAKRANVDGLYPPVFYAVMAPLATTDIPASVVIMRVANSAFAVALLSGVFFALPRRLRPALVISVLATSVPLGIFLLASTNPSSWAILSAATVWISLYGALQTQGRRRLVLTGLAVFGGFIGAGARADSAAYAVFGVGIALILGLRAPRWHPAPLIGAAATVAVSAAFYLTSGQSNAAVSGLGGENPPLKTSEHITNFLGVPGLWAGALGKSGLGWLDTVMPDAVWVLTLAVFAAAIFVGVRHSDVRRTIAVASTLLAMWIVPFVLLAQSRAMIGTQVQPRYILPLMVLAVGVASLRVDAENGWRGRRFVVAAIALAFAATVSLQVNIQRYTTGLDSRSVDPGAGAEWWWSTAPSPVFVWAIGAASFSGMLALWWFALRSGTDSNHTDMARIVTTARSDFRGETA